MAQKVFVTGGAGYLAPPWSRCRPRAMRSPYWTTSCMGSTCSSNAAPIRASSSSRATSATTGLVNGLIAKHDIIIPAGRHRGRARLQAQPDPYRDGEPRSPPEHGHQYLQGPAGDLPHHQLRLRHRGKGDAYCTEESPRGPCPPTASPRWRSRRPFWTRVSGYHLPPGHGVRHELRACAWICW